MKCDLFDKTIDNLPADNNGSLYIAASPQLFGLGKASKVLLFSLRFNSMASPEILEELK